MKIDDVLADEVIKLCIGVGMPVAVEVQTYTIAEIFKLAIYPIGASTQT